MLSYHILNGDSLLEQFPKEISGERIVMRECLIEGDVSGNDLNAFLESRKNFMQEAYNVSKAAYEQGSETEILKIKNLKKGEVHLWFEEDLFCQANLWFVCHLLKNKSENLSIFLVLPTANLQYGFGGMDQEALRRANQNRKVLSSEELNSFAALWKAYQAADFAHMLETAKALEAKFPFVLKAVHAHTERFPADGGLGRPERSIQAIVQELGSKEFGKVFREFNKRESIYGFGDLQVKRLYDSVI